MKKNKIYVIGGTHGSELFGVKVIGKLQSRTNANLQIRVGNLEAVSKNRRFIESDLNRSFGTQEVETLETRLAQVITAEIEKYKPDVVIDMHTSVTKVGKVGILAQNSHKLISIAEKLGMDRVVVMPDEVNHGTLIGQFASTSIALEIGRDLRSDRLAEEIADNIYSLIEADLTNIRHSLHSEIYKVVRKVQKHETKDIEYANFRHNTLLDGIPFLMGESNYADIAGFLAKKVEFN